MAEYIERDAVRNELYEADAITMKGVEILNKFPAADVVEVVRCKDCKFWDQGDCYRLELSRPNDFCSYGERKDGS